MGLAAAVGLLAMQGSAFAQDFPNRAITVVCPVARE